MEERKDFRKLLCCIVICFAMFAGFIFIVDPFYHYHKPWFRMPVILDNAVYQTPGAARNLEYNSAIVGTSMTENMHTSWFDEELGWNTMKLSYSGARSNDLQAILGQIDSRGESLEHVVMDINDYQLTSVSWTKYVERPEYLYDEYLYNDYEYLYNHDVYVRSAQRCLDRLEGIRDNVDSAYTWEDADLFGCAIAREANRDQRRQFLEERSEVVCEAEVYSVTGCVSEDFEDKLKVCQENLDNILPFIEKHPQTQFYILLPPYSMLYWEQKVLSGTLEDILGIYEYAMKEFLQYENVTVYYFQYEPDIISNLDNYRDSTHHKPEYNKYMFECIKDGHNILTMDNLHEKLEKMYLYAKEFPYLTLWEE